VSAIRARARGAGEAGVIGKTRRQRDEAWRGQVEDAARASGMSKKSAPSRRSTHLLDDLIYVVGVEGLLPVLLLGDLTLRDVREDLLDLEHLRQVRLAAGQLGRKIRFYQLTRLNGTRTPCSGSMLSGWVSGVRGRSLVPRDRPRNASRPSLSGRWRRL